MIFGLFRFDWTILLVIPAMIFAIWAQFKVQSTYKKYSSYPTRRGMTGAQAARRILDANGLQHVRIEHIRGNLNDHFDPRENVIRLSDAVHDSKSAAAIGVASHEAGHAVQHAKGYAPIKLRAAIVPVTQFGSMLAIPLFFIGLLMASDYLMLAGIVLYGLIAFFQLVTLPVEFNASSRAMKAIRASGMLTEEECSASREVLTAAALTYVAALVTSLMTLLRLIILAGGRRRD
ncbi:MAG: zinc metallopeptidase [Clostridia bacterium]|nr:zinc metallopeptidase [Clostridia bacterium]